MRNDPQRRSYASILVYTLSFALLSVSAWLLYRGNTLSSLRFVWTSIGVSVGAAITALVSLLLLRR